MSSNSRFSIAIHALTLLAAEDQPLTSSFIAGSVNTNPVVIRRILASLRAAQLLASQGGPQGGWRLLRAPAAITLRDVYRAVEGPELFRIHPAPSPDCPVGSVIQGVLSTEFERALQGMEAVLGKSTIADLLRQTRARRR